MGDDTKNLAKIEQRNFARAKSQQTPAEREILQPNICCVCDRLESLLTEFTPLGFEFFLFFSSKHLQKTGKTNQGLAITPELSPVGSALKHFKVTEANHAKSSIIDL